MAADFMTILCKEKQQDFQECGFPELCGSYSVEHEMVPMRDGICLHTILFRPDMNLASYPVILTRSCYPANGSLYQVYGENFAKRGYIFVCQYSRGRGSSEGDWEPNIHERNDGIDTLAWLGAQKWCESIGCFGHSYLALTGWAIADAAEEKLRSMFLEDYGTDRYVSAYEKGAFRHDILTSWSMENAKDPVDADYLESCRYMPQKEVDVELWGQRVESYRQYISNTNISDPFWQEGWWKELREIPSRVNIPICMVSGWYDHHHRSSMNTWERLKPVSKQHSWLIIGGWNHFFAPCLPDKKTEQDQFPEARKLLEWFQITLKEQSSPKPQIEIYQIGEDRWKYPDSWRPEAQKKKCFYLTGQNEQKTENIGRLSDSLPEERKDFSYCYDPENPVETVSGEGLLKSMSKIGSLIQPEPGYRDDVLYFLSEPLAEAVCVCGKILVELYVKTDCDDTAFTAKVMEVTPDGKAYHIRSSITTIAQEMPENSVYTAGNTVEVTCDMWDIAYTIQKVSRIRVDISSSDFPQYHIHSNYAGLWSEQTERKKAKQTVLTGCDSASRVIFDLAEE